MKNLFLPYNLALIAKQKGFDQECFGWYGLHNKLFFVHLGGSTNPTLMPKTYIGEECCLAPLYQQVLDWLRDKHNLYVEIRTDYGDYTFCINSKDHSKNRLKELRMNFGFKEYYETLNKAIDEALKLIN